MMPTTLTYKPHKHRAVWDQASARLPYALQLSAVLLLLLGCLCSRAQPLSPQLALTTSKPNITIHNYTLNGQTLYTVCPCKDRWQFRQRNGTLLTLSGCANPDMDTAGPFCEIDHRATRCPNSETLSLNTAGRGKRLVVPCLPERKRTVAGCLCSSYWSERDDVPFIMQWPILPRDQLQQGIHEGWLVTGNCSAAKELPGGPRCTVIEGSCTSMPAKAYPPPTPNQFWQILSSDSQGWDFCSDPTYDKERAAQPNNTADLLADKPANVQEDTQMETQAGCTCSPGYWTYHPTVLLNENQPLKQYLGCYNPDNDPRGAWCPVDPVSCPSHYGVKQPDQPGDVPRSLWYQRVYFDYCGEVRNKTESGCLCMGNWKPTYNSTVESQTNADGVGTRPDPDKISVFQGGVCANPPELQRDRAWCFVDYNTCDRQPAGTEGGTGELHWDYCPPSATTAPATPGANATQPSDGGIYLPTVPAGTAAAPSSTEPGLYLPSVPAATAASPPGQAAAPGGNPGTVAAGPAAPSEQQQKASEGSSSTGVPIGAIVGPIVAATVVIAAVVGLLLWRRNKLTKKHTSLQWANSHLPGMPFNRDGDIELGPGPRGGRGLPGYQKWGGANGAGHAGSIDNSLLGVSKVPGQQYGTSNGTKPQRMQYTGQQPPANLLDIESAVLGPAQPATAAAAAKGMPASDDASRMSFSDLAVPESYASTTAGSRVALMGHVDRVSSSKEGQYLAAAGGALAAAAAGAAAAGHDGQGTPDTGSGSGLPNLSRSENPAEAARQSNVMTAAAAVAAEERAASLAAIWDAAHGGVTHATVPAGAAAACAAGTGLLHQQQQQQVLVATPTQPAPGQVARLVSSPFASNGSAVLAALESTPPVIEEEEEQSDPTAAAQGKQQSHELLRNITLPTRTSTNNAPETPCHKEDPARFTPTGAAAAPIGSTAAARPGAQASSSRTTWLLRKVTPMTEKADSDNDDDTQLSGLTGMLTEHPGTVPPKPPASGVSSSDRQVSVTAAAAALGMCRSVAPPATRHMSGPMLDNNWDFDRAKDKPVRLLLQVNDEPNVSQPVTLLLLVSAPPPRPEIMATIVLPKDPPQAGVDLTMDANTDLAFPTNSFIGQGAFGQVHRALLRGRHPVAVKMLTDPNLREADPETLRSFREELMIMAKLNHPHILRCYGGNLDVANPFIVTELCECSLDKMIGHYRRKDGAGLPLKHTLTIGLHIASALWHLHPSIVHRDLKPQNVLLDINGTAKVADFGLSRMKTHTFVSTRHVEAGTAAYMAPECFGNLGVGEKVDIYALAMLLYECITGVRPWKGCNMVQIAFQVAMQGNRPVLPQADPVKCPAELCQLITDSWATNPKERPSSGEVMKALAQMIRVYVPEH